MRREPVACLRQVRGGMQDLDAHRGAIAVLVHDDVRCDLQLSNHRPFRVDSNVDRVRLTIIMEGAVVTSQFCGQP